MRVLTFTRYGRLGASSRLRFFQYLAPLSNMGFEFLTAPLLRDSYLHRLYGGLPVNWFQIGMDYASRFRRLLLSSSRADVIWLEKELFPNLPPWCEQALSLLDLPVIADYDDAIFLNYENPPSISKWLLRDKIERVMQSAALVICGNPYLAEQARRSKARRIEIVPTVVDIDRYRILHPTTHDKVVIGWMGSPSTSKYVTGIESALRRLAANHQIQLRIVGADIRLSGIDCEVRPWAENEEVREIQDFDIGIMPLGDTPWERGKCGYKLIQYMACGKPVVASPVGINTEIVQDGEEGFLAVAPDDWLRALTILCEDTMGRKQMGMRGRLKVERKYTLQSTIPVMAELFRSTAKGEY